MTFDDDDLALAFQLQVLDELIGADLAATVPEQRFLDRNFPTEILRSRGFVDAGGDRTDRYRDALASAGEMLPLCLDVDAKLRLLGACYRLAVADHELRIGEGTTLLAAARRLGLTDDEFDAFLAARPGATGMSAAQLDRDD